MPKEMIRTKEVRAQVGITRNQISRYRLAGLFPYDPIAIRKGELRTERVYPQESLTHLEVLEGLRERGFTLSEMMVLFCAMAIGEGTRDFISFDEKARIVITPERLEEAKRVIELVLKSYSRGYKLPPQGERPFGKG